jgi:hypothetical protein
MMGPAIEISVWLDRGVTMVAFEKDLDRRGLPIEWEAEFEHLLPEIENRARQAFYGFGPTRAEALVAEAAAYAFKIFVLLAQRGKADIAYARPLAALAVQQVCTARRLPGSSRFQVALESTCKINHGGTNT